jgi:Amt family ammonium transporter
VLTLVDAVGLDVLGVVAGGLSALAVGLKYRLGYDDSLDVVGVHLVAGLWGTIGAGLLAPGSGLFDGGGPRQLGVQIVIALASLLISGILTAVIGLALKRTLGWRVTEDVESDGIDQSEHGESAYELSGFGGGRFGAASAVSTTSAKPAKTPEGASA